MKHRRLSDTPDRRLFLPSLMSASSQAKWQLRMNACQCVCNFKVGLLHCQLLWNYDIGDDWTTADRANHTHYISRDNVREVNVMLTGEVVIVKHTVV